MKSDERLRSLVNEAVVATEAEAPFPNGVHLWELGLKRFVSSFNSTIVLDGEFKPASSDLIADQRTILVAVCNSLFVQCCLRTLHIVGKSSINFDADAIYVANFDGLLAVAFSDRRLTVFGVTNGEINEMASTVFDLEISAIAMTADLLALAFWQDSVVCEFKLLDFAEVSRRCVDTPSVSSLLSPDDA